MSNLAKLPFNFKSINKDYLISNLAGQHQFMKEEDFIKVIDSDFCELDPKILASLESKSFLTPENQLGLREKIISSRLATRIYDSLSPPSLFMVVPTLRCDHDCNYCQVSRVDMDAQGYDLDEEHIDNIIKHIRFLSREFVKIEFQGGEPLVNFLFIKKFVSKAKTALKDKKLNFVIATALGPITDEIIKWISSEKIHLSISIDGIESIHNSNRPSKLFNSFKNTTQIIRKIRDSYPDIQLSALTTVTKLSLTSPENVIKPYIDLGFKELFIRPLSPYGFAVDTWKKLGYTAEEFFIFYEKVLDIAIDNDLIEYSALLHLNRIFKRSASHVDLKSPAGVLFGAVCFDYSGNIFGSDESRMLYKTTESKELILGHISDSPKDICTNENLTTILKDTFIELNPGCCDCAYNQFCGADPIYHLSSQGDLIGDKSKSFFCQIEMKMFDLIFEKYYTNSNYFKKFNKWLVI